MTTITELADAIIALPAAITEAGAAVGGKLDTLNAEIAVLTAEQVSQATIDGFTADVNAAIAAVQALTALATA